MTQAALPLLAALPPPVFAEHAAAERLQHMSIEAAPQAQRHEQQVLQPPLLSTYQEEKSPSGRPPIHQRHTASSRLHALADPETECAAEIRAVLRSGEQQPHGSSVLAQLPAGVAEYARRRGESMRELVERKRQIFRAQMSLDTKRSEIAKLEQRTRQWDEALLASEAALEADFKRFEDHLKENDARLQEALKRADAEGRARADKAAEAKRLASSIAAMRSEMGKMEEQLEECRRLKAFLDSVTPQEWVEDQAAKKAAKREAIRGAWKARHDALAERRAAAAAAAQSAEHDMQWARTQQQFEGAERAHREAVAALRDAMAEQEPPEPDYSNAQEEGEGEPDYFQEPAQLLAVFSAMEGSNMFQIQTAQDAEAALEAARAEHAATTARQDGEAARLRRQAAELEAAAAAHRARGAQLRALAEQQLDGEGEAAAEAASSGPQAQHAAQQGLSLAELAQAVAAAYEAAGFVRDAAVSPLQMLQKLEARLEEWLAAVGLPGGPTAQLAEDVERAREKERRQAARADKMAAQLAEHEARVARVLARAAAPRFQKSGKPKMTRSVLRRAKQAPGCEQGEGEEDELRAFLAQVDEGIPPEA